MMNKPPSPANTLYSFRSTRSAITAFTTVTPERRAQQEHVQPGIPRGSRRCPPTYQIQRETTSTKVTPTLSGGAAFSVIMGILDQACDIALSSTHHDDCPDDFIS